MLRRSVNSAAFAARANEYGGLKGSREFPDSYHTKSSNIDVAVASCHLSGRTIHIFRFPTTALGAALLATTVAIAATEEQRQLWAERSETSRTHVMEAGVEINEVEEPPLHRRRARDDAPGASGAAALAGAGGVLVFGVVLAWQGAALAESLWPRRVLMLGITEGIRALPMAISGALTAVSTLYQAVALATGRD
ncbi:hypothetical protein CSE45_5280 [Citreicella sp. SE45]|nr:hypothetical protein CSE45_5280 [Citreicella sp. SE45]